MEVALRASGVSKSYAATVLDDVSFEVEAGTIHGLLGPNGAGKTTLLRICLGLVHPDAGAVTLLGRPADAGLAGVAGFVESPNFWPYLSARKTLRMLADLEGLPVAGIEGLLERVGLADRAGAKVGSFSVGMKQRLGIAAALLREPRLLVLDEPSTGLDVAGVRDLHATLRELAAAGTAVVLSSHIMSEVDALCSHATVLAGGRVVSDATMTQLRALAPDPRLRLSTSDDARAMGILVRSGLSAELVAGGLETTGTTEQSDAAVLALAAAGIAVRGLARVGSPLGELFLTLTGTTDPDPEEAT